MSPPEMPRKDPAARALETDELLACLLAIARAHGEGMTPEAAMAGLPAEHERLTPELFARAARHAHLSAHMVRQELGRAKDALLPAVLLLHDERACVLLGFDEERARAQVLHTEATDAPVWAPLQELARDHTGVIIYVCPM